MYLPIRPAFREGYPHTELDDEIGWPRSCMCGIAGFSLSSESSVDRTLAAQALLAGISERGADAVGYAHRSPGEFVRVTKLRGGASALLDELDVPADSWQALIHVRDFTKGHPSIEANNHPIRHGNVVGIHNGIIENDDALLARYGIERAEPQMTVDSEAIFALMERRENDARALSEMRGAMRMCSTSNAIASRSLSPAVLSTITCSRASSFCTKAGSSRCRRVA